MNVLHIDKNDPNRNFFLSLYKDIVRTDDGFCLRPTYEEAEDGNLNPVDGHDVSRERTHNCHRCIHFSYCGYLSNCTIRTALENCPKNSFIPNHWVANCDAYDPVYPLNVIQSEGEMVNFIARAENLFNCPEDYEAYFGFERNWDEDTGDILETTMEYYNRGGKFENIPDRYPCVIYFGVVDFNGERSHDEKLDWIYIGEDYV